MSNQLMPSTAESYAFVNYMYTPENPLFVADFRLYNVRRITEQLKASQGQGPTLFEALHLTFNEMARNETFPTQHVEVRDNKGVKRFKFHPDYAEHLVAVMGLISETLNDYLHAAEKPRAFSFGKSELYDMEFVDLIYCHWSMKLILEAFEQRLIAHLQRAKEAIELFMSESEFNPGKGAPRIASPALSTSTVFATKVRGLINSDQVMTTAHSPQAEDQRWAQQLQQNIELPFASIVAASTRKLELNTGLGEILGERQESPEVEPLIDLLDQQPENVPLPSSPSTSTTLESPKPLSAAENPTIQELLDKWSMSRLQPTNGESAQDLSGTGSTQPLVEFYLNQKDNPSNRPSDRQPSRAPAELRHCHNRCQNLLLLHPRITRQSSTPTGIEPTQLHTYPYVSHLLLLSYNSRSPHRELKQCLHLQHRRGERLSRIQNG